MIDVQKVKDIRGKLISLKELQVILNISRMSIYRLFEKKELVARKWGGKVVVNGTLVYELLKKRKLLTDEKIDNRFIGAED
jgi:DNA-binding winged helix-turn-helix (wHTH) protein